MAPATSLARRKPTNGLTTEQSFAVVLGIMSGAPDTHIAKQIGVPVHVVAPVAKEYRKQWPRELRGEVALSDRYGVLFPGQRIVPYNPSWLVQRKGLSIFDEMRKDDQVKAALSFKKLSVLASGWEIKVPKDEKEEWEPAEFLRSELDGLTGSFSEVVFEVLSALDYGYSVSEMVFEERVDGQWRGRIGIGAIKTRYPHNIEFDVDDKGNLKDNGIIQNAGGQRLYLPKAKFVVFQHQKEFGNLYGRSDLEAAYRPWWLKENAYRWLGMLLERYGIPPVFALYNPQRMAPEQVTQLVAVIQKIQAATAGALPRPDKDSLELWTPELGGQTSRVFLPALEMVNQDIARALLMPNLLGMTQDQGTGSLARARVHFDAFLLSIEHLRTMFVEVVNDQLVRPLIDLNFTVDTYPRFQFLPISDDIRVDLLDTWTKLLTAGAVSPQTDDEMHIRKLVDFPDMDESKREAPPEPQPEPVPEPGQPPKPKPQPEGEPPPADQGEWPPSDGKTGLAMFDVADLKLERTVERAYSGTDVVVKTLLVPQQLFDLGRAVALDVLRAQGFADASLLATDYNEFGHDVLAGKTVYEVRVGQSGAPAGKRAWTLGDTATVADEQKWLAGLSSDETDQWRAFRTEAVVDAKRRAVQEASKEAKVDYQLGIVGLIVNPDRRVVDVYLVPTYEARVQWESAQAVAGYLASYRYGGEVLPTPRPNPQPAAPAPTPVSAVPAKTKHIRMLRRRGADASIVTDVFVTEGDEGGT